MEVGAPEIGLLRAQCSRSVVCRIFASVCTLCLGELFFALPVAKFFANN